MGAGDVSLSGHRKVSSEHQMRIPLSEMITQVQEKCSSIVEKVNGDLFQGHLEKERERISGQY